jgi:3-phosphoshikimate 1-carboxyvinyltransferase
MKVQPKMFEIEISGSKSESNRALILQSFSPNLRIDNLSNSEDTQWMQAALTDLKNDKTNLQCGHAGTVIRFIVARSVFEPNFNGLITGSSRLLSRPIQALLDALKPYAKNIEHTVDGIRIESKSEHPNEATFTIDATNSSQFVSALCLCAPRFKKGISIKITGTLSSVPYIEMTLDFLKQQGYNYTFTNREIKIVPSEKATSNTINIEPDWSSLSYWFSLAVITQSDLFLNHYRQESLQADAKILDFAESFGMEYKFCEDGLTFMPNRTKKADNFNADFDACPDIAPTFMALCAAINLPCKLTGLHSLKHKECDRIVVMHENLHKLGYNTKIGASTFEFEGTKNGIDYTKSVEIHTDLDHRIAMSIAPLQFLFSNISFDDKDVVGKSYTNFWSDFTALQNNLNS